LTSKRSLLAFTWTVTTILTFLAFLLAIAWTIQVHSHYRHLLKLYGSNSEYSSNYYQEEEGENNNNNNNNNEQHNEDNSHDSQDNGEDEGEINMYIYLAQTRSTAMGFVAMYVFGLSLGLVAYGSTAIVGFMSLRGVYIAPCFSSHNQKLKVGLFGGAVVVFCNLLLLCGVILGEFRVEDYLDGNDNEDREPYKVERIATILAALCLFLAVLWCIFAILLFLHLSGHHSPSSSDSSKSVSEDNNKSRPLVTTANPSNASPNPSTPTMAAHYAGMT